MRLALLLTICAWPLLQAQPDDYRVYTEHPRLFLRPGRLRLLKRERERESMRWKQFDTLVSGGAQMAEPGLALSLYYQVTGNQAVGKKAVEFVLGPNADLRQMAIVYDWCQNILTESQASALAAKIRKAISGAAPETLSNNRDRALAAIAIAEQDQNATENTLRQIGEKWWKIGLAPRLEGGVDLDPGGEFMALLELMHAIRDNLTIDMRQAAPQYFKTLAAFSVTCNYPAAYPAAENEYHIPVFIGSGEPDLNRAALARAAGLSLVAFDTNDRDNQFLQGWLIQDRFILRGVFGAPYEFLWANPYQPGLAYAHLPLTFYDPRSGDLFLRAEWEEDATWFALHQGEMQVFRNGKITVLAPSAPASGKTEPIPVGPVNVLLARNNFKFRSSGEHMFLVGLKPRTRYDVEVDDEELTEMETDVAGTLVFHFGSEEERGVRLKESPAGATSRPTGKMPVPH